jgi:hypothetical protein
MTFRSIGILLGILTVGSEALALEERGWNRIYFNASTQGKLNLYEKSSRKTWHPQLSQVELNDERTPAIYPGDSTQFGRLKLYESSVDSRNIYLTFRRYTDGLFLMEALEDAFSQGKPITIYLAVNMRNENSYANYVSAFTTIQVDEERPLAIHDFIYAWKRKQELKSGRYFGVRAHFRKAYDWCSRLVASDDSAE